MNRIMISPSLIRLKKICKAIFFRFGEGTIRNIFIFVRFPGVLYNQLLTQMAGEKTLDPDGNWWAQANITDLFSLEKNLQYIQFFREAR